MTINDLKIDEKFTNKQIMDIFQCANSGGMRRSHKTESLVVIADHTKSLYDDKWIDNVIHYTGMGTTGDQDQYYMQNKTLTEAKGNGVNIYLFEVFKRNEYIFKGQVELSDEPYQEVQPDINGDLRKVWIFPLKVIDNSNLAGSVDSELIDRINNNRKRVIKKMPDLTLEKLAKECQSKKVGYRKTVTNTYQRNIHISEYVKRMAKGKCQLCGEDAPFNNLDNEPYLESHHIKWLSQGGADTLDNIVALCPNCHKKMHILNLEEDKKKLIEEAKKCNS